MLEIVSLNEYGIGNCCVDAPLGEYYFKEIETDNHYMIDDSSYVVVFAYAGQTVETVSITANDSIAILNELKYGNVVGTKVDENGDPIEGVVFGLFSNDETEFSKETAILLSTTDENGEFSFENIPYGKWIVREVETAESYVLLSTNFDVVINNNDDLVDLGQIENKWIRGNVEATKVDAEYPDHKLSGATFEIYYDSNENGKYDDEDTLVGTLEENDGVYSMENLVYGTYFLHETKAPEGFLIDDGYYIFKITVDGETVNVSNDIETACFINKPIKGELDITKTDVADGKLLPNAGFVLTGKYGEEGPRFVYNVLTDEV